MNTDKKQTENLAKSSNGTKPLLSNRFKLSSKQIKEINNIFERAEVFISKTTRKSIFDIDYIKIKDKIILGWHLECYARNKGIPKHSDIQFWIGEVTDFKENTIDEFLEDFQYDKNNGLEIEKLKISEIENHKNKLYEIICKNV